MSRSPSSSCSTHEEPADHRGVDGAVVVDGARHSQRSGAARRSGRDRPGVEAAAVLGCRVHDRVAVVPLHALPDRHVGGGR